MVKLDKINRVDLDAELTRYYSKATVSATEPFVFPGLSLLDQLDERVSIREFEISRRWGRFNFGSMVGFTAMWLGLALGLVATFTGVALLYILTVSLLVLAAFYDYFVMSPSYKLNDKRKAIAHIIRKLYVDNTATRNAYRSWVEAKYGIVLDDDALTESFKRNVFTLNSGVSYRQDKEYDVVSSIRELSKEEADAFYAPFREVV